MKGQLTTIHHEIIRVLSENNASYVRPVNSDELGKSLNITPSYIREQANILQKLNIVGVRKGPGGGYFLIHNNTIQRGEKI